MKILIIIPAYNESESIKAVVSNMKENFPQYDYVVINDGSSDNTLKILQDNHYHYVSLSQNLGIGGGVQTGYRYALENDYDIAVQMDGDGQHDPFYIAALLQPILNGQAELVIGSRFIQQEGFQTSAMRRLGIQILRKIIKIVCGYDATDATSGFRAASKRMIAYFSTHYAYDYPEPEAIVSAKLNGYKIIDVPVQMKERTTGRSSISGLKSAYYMLKVSLSLILLRMSLERKK